MSYFPALICASCEFEYIQRRHIAPKGRSPAGRLVARIPSWRVGMMVYPDVYAVYFVLHIVMFWRCRPQGRGNPRRVLLGARRCGIGAECGGANRRAVIIDSDFIRSYLSLCVFLASTWVQPP
jgi:hypothetical protein